MTRIISVVLLAAFSTATAVSLAQDDLAPALPKPPAFAAKLPPPATNNLWYEYNDSKTVIVFVHGILGDSRDTWLYRDQSGAMKQYWPELVLNDKALGKPSIFLGGYYTEVDSASYDVRDAAAELWSAMNRDVDHLGDRSPGESVMQKKHIIFVAHSTGGIVARYLLYQNREAFRDKVVGLMLIASPSYGSTAANTLGFISEIYQQTQAKQLKFANDLLVDLDKNFKNLVYQRKIPDLLGVEALENHFIVRRKVFPDLNVLVDENSGARYFGAGIRLRNTDHFTAVKPLDRSHPAHEQLSDFMRHQVRPVIMKAAEARVNDLQKDAMGIRGSFEKLEDIRIAGKQMPPGAVDIQWRAIRVGDELAVIPNDALSLRSQFMKYTYSGYAYTMAARIERSAARKIELASKGLHGSQKAIALMTEANERALGDDSAAKELSRWFMERSAANFVRYQIAFAHAVRLRAGGGSTVEDVKNAARNIDSLYWEENLAPPDSDLDLVLKGTSL